MLLSDLTQSCLCFAFILCLSGKAWGGALKDPPLINTCNLFCAIIKAEMYFPFCLVFSHSRRAPASMFLTRADLLRRFCPNTSNTITWQALYASSTCVSISLRWQTSPKLSQTLQIGGVFVLTSHFSLRRLQEGGEYWAERAGKAGARWHRVPAPLFPPGPWASAWAH